MRAHSRVGLLVAALARSTPAFHDDRAITRTFFRDLVRALRRDSSAFARGVPDAQTRARQTRSSAVPTSVSPQESEQARQRALTALGAAISVIALAAIVVWALNQDPSALRSGPHQVPQLAGAIAFYLAGCLVRAERWYQLLRCMGAHPRRGDAYGLTAVGHLGNNVLPARAGDALRVVLMVPRASSDARTVIGTIIAERVLDVVAMIGILVMFVAVLSNGGDVPSAGRLLLAAVLVAVLIAVTVSVTWRLRRRKRMRGPLEFVAPMADVTRQLRSNHGSPLVGITLVAWALELTGWWLAAQAVGVDLSPLQVGYLVGVAAVSVLVPSGPGYIGTFDAAVVIGVHTLGFTGTQALSCVLALRLVVTVPITLVGLAVLTARYGRRVRPLMNRTPFGGARERRMPYGMRDLLRAYAASPELPQ